MSELRRVDDTLWEIPASARPDMRVPARAGKEVRGGRRGPDVDEVLRVGSSAVGAEEDVELTESRGRLPGADADAVSQRAKERGRGQLGTMGSGNHFVEVQRVDRIL